MATTKKALAMAKDLVQDLAMRQSALAVTETFDSDGSPLIRVGTGVAGTAGCLIKIMPISWPLALDVLGLAETMFTPHVVKLNLEANFAGTTDNVADNNTFAQLAMWFGVTLARGARLEVYTSTYGTAPNATDLANAAKLVATFDPNPQFPMVSSQ